MDSTGPSCSLAVALPQTPDRRLKASAALIDSLVGMLSQKHISAHMREKQPDRMPLIRLSKKWHLPEGQNAILLRMDLVFEQRCVAIKCKIRKSTNPLYIRGLCFYMDYVTNHSTRAPDWQSGGQRFAPAYLHQGVFCFMKSASLRDRRCSGTGGAF